MREFVKMKRKRVEDLRVKKQVYRMLAGRFDRFKFHRIQTPILDLLLLHT